MSRRFGTDPFDAATVLDDRDGLRSLAIADLDGDGDDKGVGTAADGDEVFWLEKDDGEAEATGFAVDVELVAPVESHLLIRKKCVFESSFERGSYDQVGRVRGEPVQGLGSS